MRENGASQLRYTDTLACPHQHPCGSSGIHQGTCSTENRQRVALDRDPSAGQGCLNTLFQVLPSDLKKKKNDQNTVDLKVVFSGERQSKSVMHMCVPIAFQMLSPYRFSHSGVKISLCSTVGPRHALLGTPCHLSL